MIALRWLSFAFPVALLLSTSTYAGELVSPIEDPEICGQIAAVDGLTDPNVFVLSPDHCESLCKKAEATCKKYTRKIASCYSSIYADSAGFVSKYCNDLEPSSAVRACKSNVASQLRSLKLAVEDARDSGLSDCSVWGNDCLAACE